MNDTAASNQKAIEMHLSLSSLVLLCTVKAYRVLGNLNKPNGAPKYIKNIKDSKL